jgi:uncharacterized protein (DUF1778 family)
MPSTSRIDIRLTEEEKKIIQQKAAELNMSMSTYLIFVGVNTKVDVKIREEESMLRINVTATAKKIAAERNENWLTYTDTYRQISKETIQQKDAEGYDLYQLSENNQHKGWEWVKRVTVEGK